MSRTGASDPCPSGYLLAEHVEDARAVIEATGDRPVVLVFYTFKGRGHALYATATAEFIQVVRSFLHTDRPGASPA